MSVDEVHVAATLRGFFFFFIALRRRDSNQPGPQKQKQLKKKLKKNLEGLKRQPAALILRVQRPKTKTSGEALKTLPTHLPPLLFAAAALCLQKPRLTLPENRTAAVRFSSAFLGQSLAGYCIISVVPLGHTCGAPTACRGGRIESRLWSVLTVRKEPLGPKAGGKTGVLRDSPPTYLK